MNLHQATSLQLRCLFLVSINAGNTEIQLIERKEMTEFESFKFDCILSLNAKIGMLFKRSTNVIYFAKLIAKRRPRGCNGQRNPLPCCTPGMCTAGQRVLLTITGPRPSFFHT